MLATLDVLSGGRLVAGVGPGSSARDYAAIGVPFEERWRRFDEAIRALRSLLGDEPEAFAGSFCVSSSGRSRTTYASSSVSARTWCRS